MTYRVALTYHPEVGTFRGKRGAWRVHHPDVEEPRNYGDDVYPTAAEVYKGEDLIRTPVLVMSAAREYRTGTFVNPLKILKEYQSTKRSNEQ